jgi:alkylation response protein AidB-like acyl-CoA dehydrogenase
VQRAKAGQASPALPNLAKLMMSHMTRLSRDLGLRIIGPAGTVMGPDTPGGGVIQELALFSPAPSIYGGTDEVQRNIIGERVLGLPKEPGPDKDTPFSELRTN